MWPVKHKAESEPFYFESFQKLKKAELEPILFFFVSSILL